MTLRKAPYFLFVPLSTDSGGTGEYMRCLIIARALRERWPSSRIDFVLHENAPYAERHPFGSHTYSGFHKDKAARKRKLRLIYDLLAAGDSPDVVFFDGTGRSYHYLRAFLRGIPVVRISSKPGVIRRGFSLSRLICTRQHWILQHVPRLSDISPMQSILAAVFGVKLIEFEAFFEEPGPSDGQADLETHGMIGGEPFVLFVPGGGTYSLNGRSVVDIFTEAAGQISRGLGIDCVVVGKSGNEPPSAVNEGVKRIEYLENRELVSLMRRSRLCVCGGGNMIAQPLANRKAVVAVPLGRPDQVDRVAKAAAMGTVIQAEAEPGIIALSVKNLLSDERALADLERRVDELDIRNGTDAAVRGVESLMES